VKPQRVTKVILKCYNNSPNFCSGLTTIVTEVNCTGNRSLLIWVCSDFFDYEGGDSCKKWYE